MSIQPNNPNKECDILLKYDYDKRVKELQEDNCQAAQRNKELKERVSKLYSTGNIDQIASASKLAAAQRVFKQHQKQTNQQCLLEIEQILKTNEFNQNLASSSLTSVRNSFLNALNNLKSTPQQQKIQKHAQNIQNSQKIPASFQQITNSDAVQDKNFENHVKNDCPPKNSVEIQRQEKNYHEPVYMVQNSSGSSRSNNNEPVYMKQKGSNYRRNSDNISENKSIQNEYIQKNSEIAEKKQNQQVGDQNSTTDEAKINILSSDYEKSDIEKQEMSILQQQSNQKDFSDVTQCNIQQICDDDNDKVKGTDQKINDNKNQNEIISKCSNNASKNSIYASDNNHNEIISNKDTNSIDDNNKGIGSESNELNKHTSDNYDYKRQSSILKSNKQQLLQVEINSDGTSNDLDNNEQNTSEQVFQSDQRNTQSENSEAITSKTQVEKNPVVGDSQQKQDDLNEGQDINSLENDTKKNDGQDINALGNDTQKNMGWDINSSENDTQKNDDQDATNVNICTQDVQSNQDEGKKTVLNDVQESKQQSSERSASPLFALASTSSSPARKIRKAAFDDDDFDF